jgi:hypothetical protein
MPGPRRCFWRTPLTLRALCLCCLLQSNAPASVAPEGCAIAANDPTNRQHHRHPNPGRITPPIRPDMIFGKDTTFFSEQKRRVNGFDSKLTRLQAEYVLFVMGARINSAPDQAARTGATILPARRARPQRQCHGAAVPRWRRSYSRNASMVAPVTGVGQALHVIVLRN